MARFYGVVGYVETVVNDVGVWSEKITEKPYYGDVIRLTYSWNASQSLNDNLTLNHRISIVADPFAYSNFNTIKYVTWMDQKWKVTSVEVDRPRIMLSLGGVFNEETP